MNEIDGQLLIEDGPIIEVMPNVQNLCLVEFTIKNV